jgi:ApaG protein
VNPQIEVSVEVEYVPEHSQPGRLIFVYTVTILNHSQQTVQLLEREWTIREASGEVTEVQGEGVVGEQPIIEPNQGFRYNSFCPIAAPPGQMAGFYTFQNQLGERFKVEIPAFALRLPGTLN